MSAVAFDTLKFARALREKAHLTTEQAEGFAEAINDALHDDLATKADLKTEIAGVRADLREAELRLDGKIETTAYDLKIWLGSIVVVAVGVILTAIRYLSPGAQ